MFNKPNPLRTAMDDQSRSFKELIKTLEEQYPFLTTIQKPLNPDYPNVGMTPGGSWNPNTQPHPYAQSPQTRRVPNKSLMDSGKQRNGGRKSLLGGTR